MINHFWTLLLNVNGADCPSDLKGSEYVDPNYQARKLPDELIRFRKILFGSGPDFTGRVFRSQQLMRLLTAFGWSDELARYDSRSSLTAPALAVGDFLFRRTCNVSSSSSNVGSLLLQTKPEEDNGSGKLAWRFLVSVSGGSVSIDVTDIPAIGTEYDLEVDAGGLTDPIELPGLEGSFRLKNPTDGDSWQIDVQVHPATSIHSISQYAVGLPAPRALALLGDVKSEPGKSWWNVWSDHPEHLNRICPLICGMVRTTNSAPVLG